MDQILQHMVNDPEMGDNFRQMFREFQQLANQENVQDENKEEIMNEFFTGARINDVTKIEEVLGDPDAPSVDALQYGKTALTFAAMRGHTEAMEALIRLKSGLSVSNEKGEQAIHYAAFRNQPASLKLLVDKGADINARSKQMDTALHLAVKEGHFPAARKLLELGAHASLQDINGDTPLHIAILKNRLDMMELLMEKREGVGDADLTVANKKGWNALHTAVLDVNDGAIRTILSKNKERSWLVDERKEDGFAAIHLAACNNLIQIAETLITAGKCNVNITNTKKETALQVAICAYHVRMVRFLIGKGCDIALADKDGNTPLHMAVNKYVGSMMLPEMQPNLKPDFKKRLEKKKMKLAEIACILAAKGADLNVKNKDGKTALDLCLDEDLCKRIQTCSEERSENPFLALLKNMTSKTPDFSSDPSTLELQRKVDNLEEQLETIQKKYRCPICLDRPKNLAFMCGHATCQNCGDKVNKCPICRKEVDTFLIKDI